MPDVYNYYPAITDIVTLDDLPSILGFLTNELEQLLDFIYYKDFQKSSSSDGSSAFYSLSLVSRTKLRIELINTGIYLVLNPDYQDDNISSFPITVFWKWEIIKFFNVFNSLSNSYIGQDLFSLGLTLSSMTEEQVINEAIGAFVLVPDASVSKLDQFVSDVNNLYNSNIIIDDETDPIQDIINQILELNQDVYLTIFNLYLVNGDPITSLYNLNNFFSNFVPQKLSDYLADLIIPKAKATLEVKASIEFPRNILLPMVLSGTKYIPDNSTDAAGNLKTAYIQFADAILDIDTNTGFGYQTDFSGTLIPQYAQIGNTPIIISFTDVKLDLSQTTNIPEADAAGYPVDFVGVYIKQGVVILNSFGDNETSKESASLSFSNFLLGTGGISGTIKLQDNGILYRNFGSFAAELDTFSITFRQNAIMSCSIAGAITLEKFLINGQPAKINIQAQIKDAGDFSITANFPPTLLTLTWPGVFDLNVRTLSVGDENGRYYFEFAGTLSFTDPLPVLGDVLPKNINISKFRVYDDGAIEFVGGNLVLPGTIPLKIGPVNLEVDHISLGTYSGVHEGQTRTYAYFGFDGMINIGSGAVKAAGNGIKYYFTIDDGTGKPHDSFIRIDQIEIDITVPGGDPDDAAFILDGTLSVSNPTLPGSVAGTEYQGTVTVQIPDLGIIGSGKMRTDPSIPSFIVDMDLELAVPIPLGGVLGIYGFRGLIGGHYVPSKKAAGLPDDGSWWDYYKAKDSKTKQEGISINKFANETGFSLGAGVNIADTIDDGYIFSSKLFILLGLPEVFLIQGQASILSKRMGIDDQSDPPFAAFISIDKTSFQGNLSVNYGVPNTGTFAGDVTRLQGMLELAFFFNNASGWYVNIGKDQPTSARIRANILTLFSGSAYLMISAQGFKVGAGTSWGFNKSFGPVGVYLNASLEMGAFVSFSPVQIGGFIRVSGSAGLKFFWLKVSIGVSVALAAEAPHPFNIMGSFEVRLHVIFHTFKGSISISWSFNRDNSGLTAPIPVIELPDPDTEYNPAIAINILTQESFPINYVDQVFTGDAAIPPPSSDLWKYDVGDTTEVMQVTVPLDSFIDIELRKPVLPGSANLGGSNSQVPGGYKELLPPQKSLSTQFTHQYALADLKIYAWDAADAVWKDYNVYEAVTTIVNDYGTEQPPLSSLPQGYWQFQEPNKFNKIRLMAQNMFSYANQATNVISNIDGQNFGRGDVFCYDEVMVTHVVDWKNEAAGTSYPFGETVLFGGLPFTFVSLSATVGAESSFAHNALQIQSGSGYITVKFNEPITTFTVDFGDNNNDVTVLPIVHEYIVSFFGFVITEDVFLAPLTLPATQENKSLSYNHSDAPVQGFRIEFNAPPQLEFTGPVNIGGYFQLPDDYLPETTPQFHHEVDADKSLAYAVLYNKSFTQEEVLQQQYGDSTAAVGLWPMNSAHDAAGANNGFLAGNPQYEPGFYFKNSSGSFVQQNMLAFSGNSDALIVPASSSLNVESGSFSFEITVEFSPFTAGISTLIHKVVTDPVSGYQRGFALHLYQDNPGYPGSVYEEGDDIPSFTVWLTGYNVNRSWGKSFSGTYTVDCSTNELVNKQYRQILVSVDRSTNKVDAYIDKVQKMHVDIPADLGVIIPSSPLTYINQLSYVDEELQRRQEDAAISSDKVITEIDNLNTNINRTVQPIWRPNTTFAIAIATTDTVSPNSGPPIKYTQVFGFQTAGPIGHFQDQSAVYNALVGTDQADQFKLADLKNYIDYDRSYPDAQSRYDVSKPVLRHSPIINLYFLQSYVNAMYSNWDAYQGLPAISSSLKITLLDPAKTQLTPVPVTVDLPDIEINSSNYRSFPPDLQLLYLLQVAAEANCSLTPPVVTITKKTKQISNQFPDLLPKTLYTALYNASYDKDGSGPHDALVHKFTFLSSRYLTFQEQVASFILDVTPGSEKYAMYTLPTSFTASYITNTLIPLLDDDPDNDSAAVQRFAVPFDRMVFGGLAIKNLQAAEITNINLVINTAPSDGTTKRILGVLICNPESFNDPKLPAVNLANTVQLTLTKTVGGVLQPNQFKYIHSRDTSAVFITNATMTMPEGTMQINFRYKIFNGTDYETEHEDYSSPSIPLRKN